MYCECGAAHPLNEGIYIYIYVYMCINIYRGGSRGGDPGMFGKGMVSIQVKNLPDNLVSKPG